MERKGVTRRHLATALSLSAAAAAQAKPQAETETATAAFRSTTEAVRKVEIPLNLEPSFTFRA